MPTKKPQSADTPPEPAGFEEALARIESITERIESGQIGLEESITEFERDMALIAQCREILGKAEQRVEQITEQMRRAAPAGQSPEENPSEPGG
jgi:exodeoxyribonuclease VII small subunit